VKRLESDTLPQYFRHSRFQSLVRQLNFYSFRKINKERNVWVYKHELFHRDRPDDLYMVRRRTCPGMDGRKQRFSRFSTRRLSGGSDDNDEESLEEESFPVYPTENAEEIAHKKRLLESAADPFDSFEAKRVRHLSNEDEAHKKLEVAQMPILQSSESRGSFGGLLSASRGEPPELSVSEVAERLEMRARKAMRGRTVSRSRRSGYVTPPYTGSAMIGVLTYDDEMKYDSDDEVLDTLSSSSSLLVVTMDGDESMTSEGERSPPKRAAPLVTPIRPREVFKPPVKNQAIALSMTEEILERVPLPLRNALIAPATVTRFCMATSPNNEKDLCSKILQLISTCETLSSEFQQYRQALHPKNQRTGVAFAPNLETSNWGFAVQQICYREASRGDVVRDFLTFAVNCIHTLLGRNGDLSIASLLGESEKLILENTVDIWLKSAGHKVC
jgi:hypothetical protein